MTKDTWSKCGPGWNSTCWTIGQDQVSSVVDTWLTKGRVEDQVSLTVDTWSMRGRVAGTIHSLYIALFFVHILIVKVKVICCSLLVLYSNHSIIYLYYY